eukprot:TCONS_00026934-protein
MVQTKLPSVYDEVFTLSPMPLQAACLSTITNELPKLTSTEVVFPPKDNLSPSKDLYKTNKRFVQDIRIPDKMAEKILEDLSNKGQISNSTLTLFSNKAKYNLKSLKLPNIDMTSSGKELMAYRYYHFRELILGCNTAINRWSMRKLIDSFTGSRYSLTILKLDLYPAVNITAGTTFDFFVQFPNLKSLEYNTPILGNRQTFTNVNWNALMTRCSSLKMLHINVNGSSKAVELDSELFLKGPQLESLTLFSVLKSEIAIKSYSCVQYFLELQNLRELDLSIDLDPPDANLLNLNQYEQNIENHTDILAKHMDQFLELSVGKLPLLESLDVSGIYKIEDTNVQNFIETHKNLRFLGLCMLQSKFCINGDAVAYYPHLKISGCYLEDQIVTSLLKYSRRATYMKEVLKGLFQITAGWTDVRRPYILKVVLCVMEEFRGNMQLQMAATACVFHLTKERDNIKHELNVELLSEVARVTSLILVIHVGNLQMVKNCLLIICTDRILHNARFDRVNMSRLCMNCMLNYPESVDRHVTRMAVAIISILACKISSLETAKLMNDKEMKLLLGIVEQRLAADTVDGTLKFDLSALWNLTDESPDSCKLFVDLCGHTIYLSLLEKFTNNVHVETKVLGLLNNIAEVKGLQKVMLRNRPLMERVRTLVKSEEVQVSYFACGIIANLALGWDRIKKMELNTQDKQIMLTELEEAIERWGRLQNEIVTYRSFKPFYELLSCERNPQIQKWAVWAIHHVCTLCSNLYKNLMDVETLNLLKRVYRQREPTDELRNRILEIYQSLDRTHMFDEIPGEIARDVLGGACAQHSIEMESDSSEDEKNDDEEMVIEKDLS